MRWLAARRLAALASLALGFGASGPCGFLSSASRPYPVRKVPMVCDYRQSGLWAYWKAGEDGRRRWTPEQVVELLRQHPGRYVTMGTWTTRPTGHPDHVEVGRVVNEVQRLGRQRGVDTSRLAFDWRNDVYAKYRERPGTCPPGSCGWDGTMKDAPFDTAWIMTVPWEEHRWSVERRWGGQLRKDPWGPNGLPLWQDDWIDYRAIAAVNTASRAVALYVSVQDLDSTPVLVDWAPSVVGVVMDLRQPAYRAWSVKKLIADLQVMGIDPGEGAAVAYEYKSGWHTFYDGRPSGDPCYTEGAHMWTGPAGPCRIVASPPGGPFVRTPYGPGEFEQALNQMLREMRAGLVAAGYPEVRLITVERPAYRGQEWSILDAENRSASWLLGEQGPCCDRRDLSKPPRAECRP